MSGFADQTRYVARRQSGISRLGICALLAPGLWFVSVAIGSQPLPVSGESLATLTNLNKVAGLSLGEAARGLALRVRGTVTFYDRDQAVLFIQEGNDAAAVRLPASRENDLPDLQPGMLIDLDATTMRGRVKCGIRSTVVRVLGRGILPEAIKLDRKNPFSELAESRLVAVQGWVPNISTAANRLSFPLVVRPGTSLDVTISGGDFQEVKAVPGSFVETVGVFSLRFDSAGQITGARLRVSDLAQIHLLKSLSISPIAEVEAPSLKDATPDPFRIRGTVVNHSLGEFLILRDSSGSIRIPYRGLSYFNAGNLVEVFAYPLQRRPGLSLTNVIVKMVPADTASDEPAATIITPTVPNSNLATLTQITQIRRLTPQEASRGYPVDITGVITFFDRPSYLHFIQDETSGIYFDLSHADYLPDLHSGQKIRVQGFSGPGDYAPIVIGRAVRVLQEVNDYPKAESVTFRKLMNGNFDSEWVLLKGVVRNQWTGTNSSSLALFAGDGLIKVVLPGAVPELHLVDAGIEIQGVCRTIFDDRRRLQGVELEVPSWKQVVVKESPAELPFKLPVTAVNDLFQFHADGSELHRARLMGVITLRSRDGSFCLQDGSGGIQIQPATSIPTLQVGTMVDVVGFPFLLNKMAMLQEALVHPVRNGITVEPFDLKPDTVLEDTLQATLVRLQGQVMEHFSHGTEESLTVRFGQKTIDAVLERRFGQDQLTDFVPGTVIQMTGIYFAEAANASAIQPFRVMLRSAQDLTVVSRPSWWTAQRTLWALEAAAGILLLALAWVRALRRQVLQRTRELHREIEHHKRTETMLESQIAERKRMEAAVARSNEELLVASRQAGMAEVATSVLHNVGNVLNSVNVSAGLVGDKIRKSKVANIARAAEMIQEHSADLAQFLAHDSKGRQLPQYLARLAQHLGEEQSAILTELDTLRKNIEHIKGIVGMQQSYAKVFGSAEPVNPTELVEDALRLNSGALVRHEVRVIREYEPNLPDVTVDKHKMLQILVNLICNARKAFDDSIQPEKLLTVRIASRAGRLKISVIDNGVGIAQENLTRIFNHGFTTRKDGHGFGLHSGALAAKEMGGALVARSDGPGKGAEFTVDIPVQAKVAKS